MSSKDWDVLMRAIRRGEHAFGGYAGTDVIRRIREARNVVGWETHQKERQYVVLS